jgi:4-amino-4-deoxy-L-arabinose transferase-like glycosyltransferase
LLSLPLALVVLGRPWPLSEKHLALVLWAGWLLPEMLYFSFTTGLFHAYYVIMLGPPLAALVGVGVWALGRLWRRRRWMGWAVLVLLTGATVLFQVITVHDYPAYTLGITVTAGLAWLIGVVLLAFRSRAWMGKLALALVCIGVLVAPLTWSALTTLNANPNVALPRAGPETVNSSGPQASSTLLSSVQQAVLDYLLANTEPDSYLVATVSAMEAAPYVLTTDRPVLTFGGFNGRDDVIDVEELARMVADGELRYVLGQGLEQHKPEIAAWLENSCSVVDVPGVETVSVRRTPGPGAQGGVLYDCGSY